ncbi:MAG: substrate-binding domain-containing protein, partial [Chloroflexota bacterium]
TGAFVKVYAGVTMNQKVTGEPDAVRQLCNGSLDMINAFSDLSPEDLNNCAANYIPTESYYLGSQAVVILGSGDFLTCLTSAEVAKVWGASSEKTVTNWNQVNASFADTPITLVAPSLGDPFADLLMLTATGQNLPTREDFAETKSDDVYRITAIGNVSGGMTYMSWQDYQALTADQQAKAKLISVDGGSGCVTPSDATIVDGTYPLSRPLKLIVNRVSMARQEVQSLLWYIASDANYPLLASNGFTGLSFSALPDLRDALQKAFIQGRADAVDAAVRAANATPEPTAEATSETPATVATEAAAPATTEPAAQATAEATTSATAEATASS